MNTLLRDQFQKLVRTAKKQVAGWWCDTYDYIVFLFILDCFLNSVLIIFFYQSGRIFSYCHGMTSDCTSFRQQGEGPPKQAPTAASLASLVFSKTEEAAVKNTTSISRFFSSYIENTHICSDNR